MKSKKVLSFVLVLAMLFTMMVPSYAAESITVTATSDKATVVSGDTFTITVKVSEATNVFAMQVQLKYDNTKLEVVECASGEFGNKFTSQKAVTDEDTYVDGSFVCNDDALNNAAENVLYTATFRVKAGATGDIAPILVADDIFDGDYNPFTVTAAQPIVSILVPAASVSLNKGSMSLTAGASETLIATVYPLEATDGTVTWASSDETVATVDQTGKVTAVAAGKATITATTSNGKTAECVVTVGCAHTNKTEHPAKGATCTVDGNIAYWSCNDCGALFSDATATTSTTQEDVTIKAAHTLTDVEAEAATCTEAGNIAYKHCTVCKNNFNASGEALANVTVAALGHTGGTADCQHKAICTHCEQPYGDLGNHKLDTNIKKDATCTDQGYETYYSCTVDGCGKLFSDALGENVIAAPTVTPALGHTLTKTPAKDATCEATGNIDYWTCSRCHKLFKDEAGTQEIEAGSEITAKLPHDMTHYAANPATCTEDGTVEYWSCSICKKNYSDENGTTVLDSTVDPALGHQMTKTEAVAPTCTEDGYEAYWTCSACSKMFSDANGETEINAKVPVEKLGHDMTHHERVEATCQKTGMSEYYKCSRCEKLFTTSGDAVTASDLVIDKIPHDYKGIYNETHHWTFCANCGATTDKAAHDFTVDEATGTKTCNCGYVVYGEGTALCDQHDTELVFDETHHWHVCKNCSYAEDKDAHGFGDWETDVEATTTTDGLKHRTCKECGYVQQEVIAKPSTTPSTRPTTRPSGGSNATSSDKVKSSKTFDAGIAAYVGLSVLSLTGSALVIGKKKEF